MLIRDAGGGSTCLHQRGAIGFVDRVRLADKANVRARVRGAPRLLMLRELVPLYELDCRAVVGLLLLRRRQGRGKCLPGTFSFTLRSTCTRPGYCLMRSTSSACCSMRASALATWGFGACVCGAPATTTTTTTSCYWWWCASVSLGTTTTTTTTTSASLGHVPTSQCHWQPVDFSV